MLREESGKLSKVKFVEAEVYTPVDPEVLGLKPGPMAVLDICFRVFGKPESLWRLDAGRLKETGIAPGNAEQIYSLVLSEKATYACIWGRNPANSRVLVFIGRGGSTVMFRTAPSEGTHLSMISQLLATL